MLGFGRDLEPEEVVVWDKARALGGESFKSWVTFPNNRCLSGNHPALVTYSARWLTCAQSGTWACAYIRGLLCTHFARTTGAGRAQEGKMPQFR